MRFETLETRTVFDQSLGAAIEFEINTSIEDQQPVQTTVPTDVQFRSDADDFRYESALLDGTILDQLVAATEAWSENPQPWQTFKLNDTEAWRKTIRHNPVSIHQDGYIIAERVDSQADAHTLLTVQKFGSDDYLHGGLYMRPDHHYRYSFDVRHPDSERTWLEAADGNWAIVTQLWGPREDGEVVLNPPFSIYTFVEDGTPYWVIRSMGDSNRITTPGSVEFNESVRIPMTNIGDWHNFDIEYVPNANGEGMVRTWLNGELVFEWIDVKNAYSAQIDGVWTGPLNPAFGLYSYNNADGQTAHFDNMILQSNGAFESSISGRITGSESVEGIAVYATNNETGERLGTHTEKNGVYVLAVPRGEYTITAINEATGEVGNHATVSTFTESTRLADIEVETPPSAEPPAQAALTLTGDVNGDGVTDVINRLADGSWQISVMNTTDDAIDLQTRRSRDSGAIDTSQPISTSVWAKWASTVEWSDVIVADFNGDGMDDIAGRATESGEWWVAESTGTGFQNKPWGRWTTGIDWLNVSVGDFNGDGMADIAGRAATNGSWWISMSNGERFVNSPWGRWTTSVDWEMLVGDFNGDGLDDIVGRASSDGSLWVGQSDGTRFENSYWGRYDKRFNWSSFAVGDFDGDGRSDIVSRAGSDGSFWVGYSSGSNFQNQYWGGWKSSINWLDIAVADVDGDGDSDLVGRAETDGSWWIARSNGEKFQNQYWGAIWSQNVEWLDAIVEDFDGDGTADLLGLNSQKWWLSV